MKPRLLFCLSAMLVAGGCAVGPNFTPPDPHAPATFRNAKGAPQEQTFPAGEPTPIPAQAARPSSSANGTTNSLGELAWWQLFRDPILQTLIATALTNNYDIRLAVARVEQSLALLAQARSGFFPQLGYQGAIGVGRNVSGGLPADTGSGVFHGGEWAGNVSWEVDLWGRLRRLNEAARAQYLATEEARHNVTITLVANIAQAYFQLLALDEDLLIAQQTTNSLSQSLVLFNQRLAGGVASKLESSSAAAALASAAATIPEVRRQIVIQENQIRVLLGFNPGPVTRKSGALYTQAVPEAPPGLPSELLQRRPDLRQALELVRSANAQVGVATANFYPHITLTGMFGGVSPELVPFTAGTVGAWSLAANLAGPIFQGGQLKAQLREARAGWDAAVFQYESAVLNAFQEVSNALVSQRELANERLERTRAVAAYQQAVEVANQRYVGGQASYYELLLQQQLLFPNQNALIQTVLDQLLAAVQLYKALGGGWNTSVM